MLPLRELYNPVEDISIKAENKTQRYEELLKVLASLVEGVRDEVAAMANTAALLHETMHFFWTGFYRVSDGNRLILGPFQGPVACCSIGYGKGVCGTAWKRAESVVVEDVEKFPGHIACSSASRSEIVVPIFDAAGAVRAVLDIDSDRLAAFDETDRIMLEKAMLILSKEIY